MGSSLQPKHIGRYAKIGALLLKHRGDALAPSERDGLVASEESTATVEGAAELVDELEAMGPTFVKLGQLLSTRADLLPPVYLDALSRLQDDVAPFAFSEVEIIVEREIGARLSNAFSSFDHEPIASASLGQVHRAVLRDGRPVAVKVQRPGIRDKVADDMEVITELAAFVDDHTELGERLGFSGMVTEFRRAISAELDYRREAENLRTLAGNLAAHERIVVPLPIDDYTTSKVLTMDLIDGRNVGSLGPLAQMELDGQALAEALFAAYLDQILVDGFVHADPHPGNVLVTTDGDLALIDLGMVVHIAPGLQDDLLRLLAAVSEGRGDEACDVLTRMGRPGPTFDADAYRQEIVRLVGDHRAMTVGEIKAGAVVGDLARAAAAHGLRPPVEMTMVGKALLNLDQVACTLDPEFDPNAAIRDRTAAVLQRKLIAGASPASLLHAAMDAKEFAERFPGRVNKVMDALAEGQLTINVEGIDEAELMRGFQKLANRVTTGVVVAALVIGAAMVMRIDTDAKLFGYPTLAIVLFLVASVAGLWLVVSSLVNDLPPGRGRKGGSSDRRR